MPRKAQTRKQAQTKKQAHTRKRLEKAKKQAQTKKKHQAQTTLMNPAHCSPGNDISHGSCLHKDLIVKVADIMNKHGKDNNTYIPIDLSQDCDRVYEDICKNLEIFENCKSEACLLFKPHILKHLTESEKKEFETSFIPVMDEDMLETDVRLVESKNKVGTKTVVPESKVSPEKWLSDKNIASCLELDMKKYPEYEFCGVEPIDFGKCEVSPLCKFDPFEYVKKNKTKIGFVFNTDTHDKGGEHWISLYMDLKGHNFPNTKAIYYCDSYGDEAPPEIIEFVNKCKDMYKAKKEKLRYFYNTEPFQKKGSQCGIYAIHFLKQMASGVPFEDYLLSEPSDKLMRSLRDKYFIDPQQTVVVTE